MRWDRQPESGDVVDDIEEIKQLKARYFRFMDTKDWAAMREQFTDDFVLDATGTGGDVVAGADADAMVALLEQMLTGATTAHHGHLPEIAVTSADDASGIWALFDLVVFPDGTRLEGYGHYHDTYRREAGRWRISSSTVTRLVMDVTPAEQVSSDRGGR